MKKLFLLLPILVLVYLVHRREKRETLFAKYGTKMINRLKVK
jgi:hypothetical protein